MNKFYLVMLIISFLYGCSTTAPMPIISQSEDSTLETRPQQSEPIKSRPSSTTEAGEAAIKILKDNGYL